MRGHILEVRDVTHGYDVKGFGQSGSHGRHVDVLHGICFGVLEGEVLGIVGESGCGKSTLARLMLGIERPDSGEVAVNGQSILQYGRLQRARLIQPVFQDPYSSLNPHMTINAILDAPLRIHKLGSRRERAARVAELVDAVGLSPGVLNAFPGQLSGGQRQRVAIARALAVQPKILVCDEPTSALDVSVQSKVLNLIAGFQKRLGLTIILISHNIAVINHLSHHIAVMFAGRVVELGTTEDIMDHARHRYTRNLLSAVLRPEPGARVPDVEQYAE